MDSCKLSGADYFLLAMEKHVQKQKGPGYVCRFIMVLEGSLQKDELEKSIEGSAYFQLLRRVRLYQPALGIARWKLGKTLRPLPVYESKQQTGELSEELLNRDIPLNSASLCEFDLIHIPGPKTLLIFSWHHLLMDGFGVNKLLASLQPGSKVQKNNFLPSEQKEGLWKQWKQLVFAKDFLRAISRDPLVKISATSTSSRSGYLVHSLSDPENEQLKSAAQQFTKGMLQIPYHLACAAIAYDHTITKKGINNGDIWVPVPMETRKSGAAGPVLTNQHSMLFFRMNRNSIADKSLLVKEIGNQLFEQVKQRVPQQYAAMTRMLRLTPTWFYYRLIKRPNGDSIAAFLFSQSPAPDNLRNFMGHRLLDATALPPNTAPPGISFQIMTFEGKLKLVLQYSESCFTRKEAAEMMQKFKQELLGANG